MAVVMQAQGPGLGPAEYDALLEATDWESQPAADGIFHVACSTQTVCACWMCGRARRTGRPSSTGR
jgi:hypothetical protein